MRDNIEAVRTAGAAHTHREGTCAIRALLRLRGPEVHPEPGKGTGGRRALGEVRPRTVRAYGGTAPNH